LRTPHGGGSSTRSGTISGHLANDDRSHANECLLHELVSIGSAGNTVPQAHAPGGATPRGRAAASPATRTTRH
jgi:hypothetical protein